MKRAAIALLVVPFIALWTNGCDQASNPVETKAVEAVSQAPLFAASKTDVCHVDGQGNYSVISISDNAYDAHIAHGDKGTDTVGGCSDGPPPPTSCSLIQFDPLDGLGYVSYPINDEGDEQYRSFLQEDLVAAVKVAAAAVVNDAPGGWPGNGGDIGLGDMSEADGSIPGTSTGSPGHPAGTHENGVDIDVAYFQTGTPDNHLRPICTTLDAYYNCDSPPVYLDAMRTALLLARLAENPRLRVVGVDALARVEIETALDQLVTDGLVDSALRAEIPLASGAGFGWDFMSAFMHVSYTDLCPPPDPGYLDSDGDGIPNADDSCPDGYNEWTYYPGTPEDLDEDGCHDDADHDPELVKYYGGSITSDQTWIYGVTHHITSDLYIGDNALEPIVTIEDGAVVVADVGVEIYVGYTSTGGLQADGSAWGIRFTSPSATPAPGDWNGIYFGPSNLSSSYLAGVTVEYGGGNGLGNIVCDATSPAISDSQVENSSNWGIYLTGGASPTLTNVSFSGNTDGDIRPSP